jgi:single-stranded-DNA-specific exonuclease
MDKRWLFKDPPSHEQIEKLSKLINTNPYLSAILLQRGIDDFDAAKKYFRPTLDDLHDPFLMKDMDKAVRRLKKALDREEKILIYGDYDVDGTTGC